MPQSPCYNWRCEGKYTCFAEPSAPVDTSEKEHNMTKTSKHHASLRGTNVVSDEAIQLTEFKRGQSASVTTLTDFATLNRGKKLNVQSCHSSVRI